MGLLDAVRSSAETIAPAASSVPATITRTGLCAEAMPTRSSSRFVCAATCPVAPELVRGFIGRIAINAGSSVTLKASVHPTPMIVAMPKSWIGPISANRNEARPALVVNAVMAIGGPEWHMAPINACSRVSPASSRWK